MNTAKNLLIGVGNVYLDNNVFGVETGGVDILTVGKDYVANRKETVAGGSAVNFLSQAKALGFNVAFVGQTGNDKDGEQVKNLLAKAGINTDLMTVAKGDATSVAYNMIFSHNAEYVGFHWGGATFKLRPEQIDLSSSLITSAAAFYFGGTIKQKFIFNALPTLLKDIQQKGIITIVDPNRFSQDALTSQRDTLFAAMPYIDLYLPNEEEIKQATMTDSLDTALELAIEKGVKVVVVKLGAKGCRIKTKDVDMVVAGYAVTPVTTVGAGDSFNAGFAISYLSGKSLQQSSAVANATAALKVSQNKYPTSAEVESMCQMV